MPVADAVQLPVSRRTYADIELLSTGAYAPLDGFLGRADYDSVLKNARLTSGAIWPVPITFSVSAAVKENLKAGDHVELDYDGVVVATLYVNEIYAADKKAEALAIYKTDDQKHPGVAALYAQGDYYVGGKVNLLLWPDYGDLDDYHLTPDETKFAIQERGWKTVVGFQTRNPIHAAHEFLTKSALESVDGLLIHPLVGATKEGDVPAQARMASYEVLIRNHYPKGRVMLSMFPGNMYYAGPREAVLHALVRKNYGCTHFIVGRDHAGVGDYYGPYEAQDYIKSFGTELGIMPLCYKAVKDVSGTELRKFIAEGKMPPPDIMHPDVADALLKAMK